MLSLILGTMKSGKSTKLLNLANSTKEDFALIAPSVSKREFFARGVENNFVVYDESFDYSKCQTLLIDEIQFFSKEYIQNIISNKKITHLLSQVCFQTRKIKCGRMWLCCCPMRIMWSCIMQIAIYAVLIMQNTI